MAIPIKINVFEGPLDLLLHLIEKNKIDIYDIPIVEITDQYMEYIHGMETEDLGTMSEFLVMAATLLDIKCKMLLPRQVNEEGEEEDPREELVQKLLEYKMYKYMSYELKDKMDGAAGVFFKKPTIPDEVMKYREPVDPQALLASLTLEKLNQIYKSILKKQESKIDPIRSKFGTIEKEEVSLSDKMLEQLSNTYKKFLAGEEMGREKKGCSFYIATQDEIRHNKYDLKVIKYVEDKIERKEIDVKDALRKIDELEERLTYIDKQFKDCAWRLRELTKE